MAYNDDEFYLNEDGTKDYEKKADGRYKNGYSPAAKKTQFKPGNKLGGRPKGSKNKKTLRQELIERGGMSPAEFLNSIMHDEQAPTGARMKAAEKLMDFTEQKLTSIELHTDEDHVAPFNIFLAGQVPTDDDDE